MLLPARSTRPVWLYYELQELYGPGHLPELQIAFVDMNEFRSKKSAEFLSQNPNGKVPLLVDTDRDVIMWESGAIVNYLLDLFDADDRLGPRKSDPKYLAAFHQFTFYGCGTVDNLMAISSPIQMVVENKTPGLDTDLINLVTLLSVTDCLTSSGTKTESLVSCFTGAQ